MAGKIFKNWSQLERFLEREIEINLQKIGTEIASVLRNYVYLNWYADHTPKYYERTMEVLNSISVKPVKKNGNKYEVEIFFDKNKISMVESNYYVPSHLKRFHHHMSVDYSKSYNGQTIAEWVVYWMNYGQNSSLHSYSGVGFLEETIEWTKEDRYHINRMRELIEDKLGEGTVIIT